MSDAKPKPARIAGAHGVGAQPVDGILTRLEVSLPTMPRVQRQIGEYILANPGRVVEMSISDFAEAAGGVSEGSVIKFCRELRLGGFQHLKLSLSQNIVQPVQFIQEDLDPADDDETVLKKIFAAGIQTLSDTLSLADPAALRQAIDILRKAKRIDVYGIGSAAPIAEDAHYRMMRIGLDARVLVDSHIQAISASLADEDVACLTISHSGATHETISATRLAKEAGAKTICITNYGRSPLQAHCDVVLYTMAKETKFRTEAMTSRIAQLCMLDALIAGLALADHDHAVQTLQSTFEVLSSKRV
ncbi:MAG: MurR/RpiR family transcriptional regulator [Pseudomonadota bacterium]